MTQLLRGIAVNGYRSFFEELQYFGPLGKVNLLAGQNNSGKSNIIRFLVEHLNELQKWRPEGLDRPRSSSDAGLYGYALALPPVHQVVENINNISNVDPDSRRALVELLESSVFHAPRGVQGLWLRFAQSTSTDVPTYDPKQVRELYDQDRMGPNVLQRIKSALTGISGGDQFDDAIGILNHIAATVTVPQVKLIHAFRQISALTDSSSDPPAGQGLIDIIAELQNPEAIDQPIAEKKYRALNRFVSDVFDQKGIRLEVPASRRTINVRTADDIVLPLENQGTGIHQVIIIAALATTYESSLVCIEEPEVNLHPVLQRRLLMYLAENTSNQYVIATHSAQLLDYERATVFHLTLSEQGTRLTPASTPAQVAHICADLGYKASDILQANAIVWVEGPSDRIYVNHWIEQVDPSLKEGIHYSIMFYGGSLLKELSVDDPTVTEFIGLRRLNRNVAILIDSDKTSARKPLNATKRRVIREFDSSAENGMAWVTHGYTVENYIPVDVLSSAISIVHPRKGKGIQANSDRWANPLASVESPDKPKIAKKVVELWPNSLIDRELSKKVHELIQFIHRANIGIIARPTTQERRG
jgi:hypothetical protein